VRLAQALLTAVLLFRHPVPALWVLLLPLVVLPLRRTLATSLVSLLPFLALVALGGAAWQRGMVNGFRLAPWEVGVGLAALVLAFFGLGGGGSWRRSSRGEPKPKGRRRGRNRPL
jgi:hypothetical protein